MCSRPNIQSVALLSVNNLFVSQFFVIINYTLQNIHIVLFNDNNINQDNFNKDVPTGLW